MVLIEFEHFITEFLFKRGLIILAASYVLQESINLYLPRYKRWIPLTAGITGALLGLFVPTIFEDIEPINRLIYGTALGWAATGIKESIKGCKRSL